jgi:O-antigen/teichoic acid export membrane protein
MNLNEQTTGRFLLSKLSFFLNPSSTLMFTQYIAIGVSLLTSIVSARMLGPTNYGTAAIIMSFPSLLWTFVSFKPASVVTRYITAYSLSNQTEELLAICKLGYILDLAVAVIVSLFTLFGGYWIAGSIYKQPEIAWLIIIFSLSYPFSALSGTSQAILNSWEKFKWLGNLQIITKIITLSTTLIFLFIYNSISSFIIATSVSQIFTGIIYAVVAHTLLKNQGYSPWWNARLSTIRPMLREFTAFFTWNYLIVSLSGLVTQIPLILLGRMSGPTDAAYYRIATNLSTSVTYLETVPAKVIYPKISMAWESNLLDAIYIKRLVKLTWSDGLWRVLFLILGIVLLPWFIPIIYGKNYSPMIIGSQLFLLSMVSNVLFFWIQPYYFSSGKIQAYAISYMLFVVGLLTSSIIGISILGFLGVALAQVCLQNLYTLGLALYIVREGEEKH